MHQITLSLAIPCARDEAGDYVIPGEAIRYKKYFCPECGSRLIYRAGPKRVPHFAHPANPECRFIKEGNRHLAAKYQVFAAIWKWKRRWGEVPLIQRLCVVCKEERSQPLPKKVASAALEFRINPRPPTNGRFAIADIALLDSHGQLLAAVEIRDSHAVEEPKEEIYGALPWLEMDAEDILRNPYLWKPIRSGNLKPMSCRCQGATRFRVTCRSNAYHIDGCPLPARVWRGIPYANLKADCRTCPHCIGLQYAETASGRQPDILFCSAMPGANVPVFPPETGIIREPDFEAW